MGHKAYTIWINNSRYIAVDLATVRGRFIAFVVRLMACDPEGDRILSRFDTAHGIAHQDLLTRAGKLKQKHWLYQLDFNHALNHAITHFKRHHEDYPG